MTYRQEKLVEYLRTNTAKEFTQKEIADNVEGFIYTSDIRNHCSEIWGDVEEINNDPENNVFIQYKKYKCKIATPSEVEKMIDKKMVNALKEFKRYWKLKKKYADQNALQFDFDSEMIKVKNYFENEE